MKKAKHIILSVLLISICLTLTAMATTLRIGDIAGYVLATDIRAFYNGYEIPVYNIDGHVGIVAEDLAGYGFSVVWNGETRSLDIKKTSDKVSSPVSIPKKNNLANGTPLMPVLYTDIVTYLEGRKIESFNIGGRTVIYFESLSDYGSYVYDNGARLSLVSSLGFDFGTKTIEPLPREILHAGGALGSYTGTNSLDALNNSHYRGHRFYELDFLLSSDGVPVALHDWTGSYSAALSKDPITAKEFSEIKILGQFTSLTADSLEFWLRMHPDTYVITDVKDDNIAALRYFSENYPHIIPRIIPQIYHYDEYASVRAMGFSNIIFTLYSLPTYEDKVDRTAYNVAFAEKNSILAVTISVELVDSHPYLIKKYVDADIPLYVHTVNDSAKKQSLFESGVTGVYTDFAE
ncbi:MAG: hypothetical protein IKU61_01915 [Clostridia bacterium]|nr:hypothetical protein [Clostridia bacterium]